jgi:predicted phosphodiesterase
MYKQWSEDEKEIVARLVREGLGYVEIGRALGRTPKSVERAVARYGLRWEGRNDLLVAALDSGPFAVPVHAEPRIVNVKETHRAVVLGDSHSVYVDEDAVSIALQIVKDFNPHTLVHLGDAVDCYSISKYERDPNRKLGLKEEIAKARELLWHLASAAHTADLYLLEGNHEDRLRRLIWGANSDVQQVLTLPEVERALSWRQLLHLDELGIQWVSQRDQTRNFILPKFLLKHGDRVRSQSAYTARAEHEQYGTSGASGHTHRLGMYMIRDHNGSHMWWEAGCLSRLDPDYVIDPNWQQGMLLMEFDQRTAAPSVTPVFILNGVATALGNVYRA